MINEFIFILHALIIGSSVLFALRLGPEALVTFVSMCAVLANLFVIKQTTLFGFTATCSDAFIIGAVLGLNVLQEYYGKKLAQKAIWISLFSLIFYALLSQVHLLYLPGIHDTAHPHYAALLGFMPRITIASFVTYFIVQQVDYLLFGFLKKMFAGKYLAARTTASLMICQLLDTVLFSFLGLYGIIENIGDIILISYTIKMAVILLSAPFVAFSRKIYKP